MEENITWGLIVCTYNRPQLLVQCVKYALEQTLPPSEIVIVDASDYWEETKSVVEETYDSHWEQTNLIFEPARVRAITHQRNQALELSGSDIIFSLDDDIFLHKDAAASIMNAYQSDIGKEISMIGGSFVATPPTDLGFDLEKGSKNGSEEPTGFGVVFKKSIEKRVERSLSIDKHFVSYDDPVSREDLPSSVAGLDLLTSGLVNGGRTTFRREFGVKVRWATILRYYALHEDGDFSYRMSKFGRILFDPNARFYNAEGEGKGRPNRFNLGMSRVGNLMALHRIYSQNRIRSAMRLALSFLYFSGLYLAIDPVRKRWSFPSVRAYGIGLILIPIFLFFPFKDFSDWYIARQKTMFLGRG